MNTIPPTTEATTTLDQNDIFKKLHRFSDSSKAVQQLYSEQHGTLSRFFNQTAHLLVRYPANVAETKKCQLQVALVNEGQYKAVIATGKAGERENQDSSTILTSLAYTQTFDPTNYQDIQTQVGEQSNLESQYVMGSYDVESVSVKFTTDMLEYFKSHHPHGITDAVWAKAIQTVDDVDFNNWRVIVNYANNFNRTVKKTFCDQDASFIKEHILIKADTFTYQSHFNYSGWNSNATRIALNETIEDEVIWADAFTTWPDEFPFYLLARNFHAREKMKVTNIYYMCCGLASTWDHLDRRTCLPSTKTTTKPLTMEMTCPSDYHGVQFLVLDRSNPQSFYEEDHSHDKMPPSWSCASALFNERSSNNSAIAANYTCHCNCGAFDPDCDPQNAPDSFFTHPRPAMTAERARLQYIDWKHTGASQTGVDGCNSTHKFCNFNGLCTEVEQNHDIEISAGCHQLGVVGDNVLNGFVGSETDFMKRYEAMRTEQANGAHAVSSNTRTVCSPCNGDVYYGGIAQVRHKS